MAPKCIKFGRCGFRFAHTWPHGHECTRCEERIMTNSSPHQNMGASISQEIQTDGELTNQLEKMNVSCNLCLHTPNEIQCVSTRSILCWLAQINSLIRNAHQRAPTGKLLTVIKSLPVCCRRIIALFVFCSSPNGEMVYGVRDAIRTNMIRLLCFGVWGRTLCACMRLLLELAACA